METASGMAPAAATSLQGARDQHDPRYLRAAELYDRHRSLARVGVELDVTPQTVAKWLDRLGIDRQPPGRRPTEAVAARRRRVAELYRTGDHSIDDLARREGVSPRSIWADLAALKIERRPQGRKRAYSATASAELQRRAVERYTAGDTLDEIARDEGVWPQTVWRHVRPFVDMRRAGRRPRHVVGDRRPRRECERHGCKRTFVAYPCESGRRHYCSQSCRALDHFRIGRVSPALLETFGGRARSRWLGRWRGRENGKLGGQRRRYTDEQADHVRALKQAHKDWGRASLSAATGLSEKQIRAILRREIAWP